MIYALVILCAVLAAVFLKKESEGQYVAAVILKGLASLCFVAIGAFCSPWNHVATLVVAGLIIGSTADVLLNLRMVFEEKGQPIFLVGILVFLTGHILYKIFGVVYIGAIMLLNCVAIANVIAAPSPFNIMFAVGAVFFLVSDIVLILNTFGSEFKQSLRNTNISLYYIGQILIALSLQLLH